MFSPRWIITFAVLTTLPNIASAHLVSTRFGDYYSGLMHPLVALAHVVPWLALGLLGALQGPATARWALLSFPLAVMLGSLLGTYLPELSWINSLNLASIALIGLLVALAMRLPPSFFIAVTALFGVSHGFTNDATTLFGSNRLLYIIGVGSAAYLLIALVTASATALRQRTQWGEIVLRAVGSWIVAVGILFGGYTVLIAPGALVH